MWIFGACFIIQFCSFFLDKVYKAYTACIHFLYIVLLSSMFCLLVIVLDSVSFSLSMAYLCIETHIYLNGKICKWSAYDGKIVNIEKLTYTFICCVLFVEIFKIESKTDSVSKSFHQNSWRKINFVLLRFVKNGLATMV